MSDLTPRELLAIYISRYLKNETFGFAGTGSLVAVAACLMAQDLYSPDLSWVAGESGFINPSPPLVKSISGYNPRTEATKSMNAIIRFLSRGFDFFLAEVGQIDEKGRINRQFRPDGSCAPGTGSTSFLRKAKNVYLFSSKHSPDILTKKSLFISAWREKKDELQNTFLFTPEGLFKWISVKNVVKPQLVAIYNQSKKPEEIAEETGFEFKVANNLEVIKNPNDEEIYSLREVVDTHGYLREYW
ncbi:MAG: hypothetical protein ACFFD1_03625 [Candidatus Thorarchaeota archaeon]